MSKELVRGMEPRTVVRVYGEEGFGHQDYVFLKDEVDIKIDAGMLVLDGGAVVYNNGQWSRYVMDPKVLDSGSR